MMLTDLLVPNDFTTTFGDPSFPSRPADPGMWSVQELWRVTEWRGSSIFRTQFVRYLWTPLSSRGTVRAEGATFQVVSLSTSTSSKWMGEGKPLMMTVR